MRRRLAALLSLLAACHDAAAPSTAPRVALLGAAERGGVALVRLVRGPSDTVAGPVTVAIAPDTSRAVLRGDTVRFLAIGAVRITAAAGGLSADTSVVIGNPATIVYQASPAGNADLFARDLDGGNARPLTTDSAEDAMPTVAQGRVVWVSRRSGRRELWATPVAGGTPQQLTNTVADEEQPFLSADGARLTWIVPSGGATYTWAGDGNAGGAARFAPADVGVAPLEASPTWGPNGVLV